MSPMSTLLVNIWSFTLKCPIKIIKDNLIIIQCLKRNGNSWSNRQLKFERTWVRTHHLHYIDHLIFTILLAHSVTRILQKPLNIHNSFGSKRVNLWFHIKSTWHFWKWEGGYWGMVGLYVKLSSMVKNFWQIETDIQRNI